MSLPDGRKHVLSIQFRSHEFMIEKSMKNLLKVTMSGNICPCEQRKCASPSGCPCNAPCARISSPWASGRGRWPRRQCWSSRVGDGSSLRSVRRPPQAGPERGSEVPRKEGTTAVHLDAPTMAVAGRHISQSLLTGPAGNGGLDGGPRVVSETGDVRWNGISRI
jgi:hypothetical protein